jgi:DNA-binding MarR family transcriptional regulator
MRRNGMSQVDTRKTRADSSRRRSKTDEAAGDVDYMALAQFRFELRKFLAFSEAAARKQKLTPQQHQALLAIKGFSGGDTASVGDLADRLLIRHHTAVELVDRMTKLGLVVRVADPDDGRRSLVQLTAVGERRLRQLSKIHLEELAAIGGALTRMLSAFRRSGR